MEKDIKHLDFRKQSISGVARNDALLGLAIVEINPTELCNRTCSFCPRSDTYPNRNLNMSVDTAILLDQQLKQFNFGGYVCVAGYGEPLLNPNIIDVILALSDHTIELITNADPILKNKHNIETLISSGVDRILISDYDSNPQLKQLENEKVRIRRYIDDGLDHFEEYGFNNRAGAMFSIASPIVRPCYIPSYKVMIDWDGTVLLCSHNWQKNISFGNIHEADISSIWNSDKFVSARRELIAGNRAALSACANCSVLGNIMGEEYAKLW